MMSMPTLSTVILNFCSPHLVNLPIDFFSSPNSSAFFFPMPLEWIEEELCCQSWLSLVSGKEWLILSSCMNIEVSLMDWSCPTCLWALLSILGCKTWSLGTMSSKSYRQCPKYTLIWSSTILKHSWEKESKPFYSTYSLLPSQTQEE